MRLLITTVLLFFTLVTTAQNYTWEVGGGGGTSNYFGDIGGLEKDGKKGPADIIFSSTRFNFAGFARKSLGVSDYFYANFQLSYIYISGDDKLSPNTGRTRRNLNFHNNMAEALAMIEFHPLIINDLGGRKRYMADLHLYLSTGIGVLYSDPIGNFGGNNVKLRPLATEGPGQIYSPIQMVIPMQLGVFVSFKGKYTGYKVHRIGFSINYRMTFTDYLDDVSTVYPESSVFAESPEGLAASYRGYKDDPDAPNPYPTGSIRGNPNSNDGYLTTMIYYSKRIRSGRKNHKLPRRQEFYGRTKRRRRK